MSFKTDYPEFASVEEHVRRARAVRAVAIATLIADAVTATLRGMRLMVGGVQAHSAPATKPLIVKASLTG